MNLIDFIPIGKDHKKTRQELMSALHIFDKNKFNQQIAQLTNNFTIIIDNGYYIPASKEEYLEFIQQQNQKICDTARKIDLAYKEMRELDET